MRAFGVLLGCVLVASCGGGGGGGNPAPPAPPPPPTFTIGGTVTGLAGSGLELRNNAGNPLSVGANGAFTFAGTVASGSAYDVTVGTQPTGVSQACVVAAGTGTANANVTTVAVTCTTNAFPLGVTVEGLFSDHIFGEFVLENNGGDPLTLIANGAATFATNLASGASYNVAVRKQPNGTPQQTCTIAGGTGTVGSGPVTGIAVSCRAQAGRFVYVAAAAPAANGVAAFTIDADTGSLTPIAGSPFASSGQSPRVAFSGPAGKFLYVWGDDDMTAPGGTTLSGYSVDPQTGVLTAVPGLLVNLEASVGPVAFHPSGAFMYLPVTGPGLSSSNRLRGFEIDATTGELAELPGFPWGPFGTGEVINSAVLSPDGASLYLATSTPGVGTTTPPTGTIRQLAVDAQTGALSGPASQITDPANAFNQLFMHPEGGRLYTRNAASFVSTSRFALDAGTGAIGARSDFNTGFGLGAVFAPLRRMVYLPEFGGTFAAPGPGRIHGIHDHPVTGAGTVADYPYETGGTNSISPALDPTHRFLAITNLGSHDVTVMRARRLDIALTPVAGSPFLPTVGTAPGSVTFDPSGRFAYLTDAATSSISSYEVDVDTGEPTFVSSQSTGGSPAPTPVIILGRQ